MTLYYYFTVSISLQHPQARPASRSLASAKLRKHRYMHSPGDQVILGQSVLKELELVEVENQDVATSVQQEHDAEVGEAVAQRLVAGPHDAQHQKHQEVHRGQHLDTP